MSTAADPATPPEEFGPYVIYERLGLGGMATVHRAKKHGIAGFERGVALKRMLSHLTEDADFVQSFIREAKVASLLVHPNIAQVYDFGRIDGIYFIAMEHVEGFDVRRILRHANRSGQAIPIGVILSIMMELCDALEYAHNFCDEHGQHLGIVHRDVSPSNLIVAHTGHLKVIDFGIAKASARSLHTESGRAKGKLGYMSPEAAMGNVLGPVSDVFSTGVVAHELLTAMPLFTAKTDFETMLRIREGEIDPPSRRNPACPPELDQIVMAALSRDPRTRLPTAGAFRHALDAVAHNHNIRVSARDVAEYISRIAGEQPRTTRAHSAANPYSSEYSAVPAPPSFRHSGTPGQMPGHGEMTPTKPSGEEWGNDDLDDWGDIPNPSSRLNVPELGAHFTPSRNPYGSSAQMPAQAPQLSVSHVFTANFPGVPMPPMTMPQQAQIAQLPPVPTAPKSRAGLVAILLLAIAGVGAGIVYLAVIKPGQDKPAPVAAGPATLKLNVTPDDAVVQIGGKVVERDAQGQVSLEPGVYSITVTKDGFVPSTSSVELKAGERTTANIALAADKPATVAVVDQGSATPAAGSAAPTDTTPPIGQDTSTKSPTGKSGRDRDKDRRRGNKDKVEIKDTEPEQPAGSASAQTPPPTGSATPVKPPDPVIVKPPPPPPPPKDTRTPAVGATAVTKLSGEVPAIKAKSGETAGQVLAKMCIDTAGRVTEVSIKKMAPEIAAQLQAGLKTWRYKPYIDPATKQASAVCFPLSFKLVFKKSD